MKGGTNYDGKDTNIIIRLFWPSLHTLFNFVILYHETAGLARGFLRNFWERMCYNPHKSIRAKDVCLHSNNRVGSSPSAFDKSTADKCRRRLNIRREKGTLLFRAVLD